MVEVAAILSGGLATRLRPLTEKVPKALIEVAGKPFIERQLTLLRKKGIRRVVLCLGYRAQQVERLVGDGKNWDLKVDYSYDGPDLLGTAGALRKARHHLGELFWVLYGDSYLDFDYRAVANHFKQEGEGKLGLMTVFANHDRWDKSNVIFKNGRILKYDKMKPSPEMEYIDYGAAILRAAALDLITNSPCDLAHLYAQLVGSNLLLGYEVTRRFYEIGSHEGIEDAARYFSLLDKGSASAPL